MPTNLTHLRRATRLLVLLAMAMLAWADAASGALGPEEVALVVAKGNRESIGLAKYYCRVRGVPVTNICEVDLPSTEEMEREHWRWAVRPEIARWLKEHDPKQRLRCLVTVWGVPLKIKPGELGDAASDYLEYLSAERSVRVSRLADIAASLDRLAGAAGGGLVMEELADAPTDKLKASLESSLQAAQRTLASGGAGGDRIELQRLATQVAGARVLLQGMGQQLNQFQQSDQTPPAVAVERYHLLRGRASAFTELRLLLDQRPPAFERDELMLIALQQTGGLLAAVEWLDTQISAIRKNETGASFDSELSLVLWPEDYQLLRWQPNYLHAGRAGQPLPAERRTLMVARIDGPSLKTCKRLIDDAIATEKGGGLSGAAYFDARGLADREGPPLQPGSYPDYDRALLQAADKVGALPASSGQGYAVTLNQAPELFQPGECPNAALYCGWYSLAKYVDAFEWSRGAVAFHLASAEARTLRDDSASTWCVKLLEDGVCATLGPVYEPYLVAFPRPDAFFSAVTQPGVALVEAYYATKPFNSWAMVLVGDPLYQVNPRRPDAG